MNFPKPLKKGDTVALIAPASSVEHLEIEACISTLEGMGYKVKIGESINKKHGFLSAPDDIRARDINTFFSDSDVNGIICLRGGYGSARILPLIDWSLIKENPKFFMGFSDITALHICLNQNSNLITFHGPMVHSNFLMNPNEHTTMSFFRIMDQGGKYKNPPGRALTTIREGQGSGRLVGGNLTLIASTLGTPYEIDTEGNILVIEDVLKDTYQLDRLFTQLKQAGKFSKLRGILIGDFKGCEPKRTGDQTLDDLVLDHLLPLNVPIIGNLGIGHCTPMSTLPLGAICHMDAKEKKIQFSYT